MKRMALVLGVMMALAMVAPADLVVVVDPGVDIGGGLTSYTVRMVADSPADQLVGFDGSFQGTLNQIKYGTEDTPTLTNAAFLTPDEQARDTHFLLWDTDLNLVLTSPNETPSLLNGVFTVNVAAQAQNLAFAQIVLSEGETAQLTGEAANAIGTVFNFSMLPEGETPEPGVTDPVHVMVFPEPMTISLLSVGVVFILRRRKPCQRRNASD